MSENNTESSSRSRRWWWVSAGFMLAIALMLGAVLWQGRHNHQAAEQQPTSSPSEAATGPTALPSPQQPSIPAAPASTSNDQSAAAQPAWADKGCNGQVSSPQGTAPQLSTVTWTPFLTSALPSDPKLGPARASGNMRDCFAHSPAGAVVAAVNYLLLENATDGRKIIAQKWTPGEGRDQALSDVASSSHAPATVAGYSFAGCAAARCNVQIAATQGGQYIGVVVPLVWQRGDWYVDGSTPAANSAVTTSMPPGFTQWGPAA